MTYPSSISDYQRGPEPLLSVMGGLTNMLSLIPSQEEKPDPLADFSVDGDLTKQIEEVNCILDNLMTIIGDDITETTSSRTRRSPGSTKSPEKSISARGA
mmetsp:Transcript_20933/g.29545  ORF Transcript_20933/g.29545 Transcript_20933/m.29545 type:complete len:100 (-) Transcript_20933:72-371(-)